VSTCLGCRFSAQTFQRMGISARLTLPQLLKLVLSEFCFWAVCFVLNYCFLYALLCMLMIAKLKVAEYRTATFAPRHLRLRHLRLPFCACDTCASRHLRLVTLAPATLAPPTVAPRDTCACDTCASHIVLYMGHQVDYLYLV
jgi:hypothetical protein